MISNRTRKAVLNRRLTGLAYHILSELRHPAAACIQISVACPQTACCFRHSNRSMPQLPSISAGLNWSRPVPKKRQALRRILGHRDNHAIENRMTRLLLRDRTQLNGGNDETTVHEHLPCSRKEVQWRECANEPKQAHHNFEGRHDGRCNRLRTPAYPPGGHRETLGCRA